jgi:2Fe-2S ferredoxin
MTTIRVEPAGLEFEAEIGETVMGAARARGLYWPTTCGGQGVCTTCLMEVVKGADTLAAMSRYEQKTLTSERGRAILQRPVRLACQAAVRGQGTLVVAKTGVRDPSDL